MNLVNVEEVKLSQQIHFRLPPAIYAELCRLAKSNSFSVGDLCRHIVRGFIQQKRRLPKSNFSYERKAYADFVTGILDLFIARCTSMASEDLVRFQDLRRNLIEEFVNTECDDLELEGAGELSLSEDIGLRVEPSRKPQTTNQNGSIVSEIP